MKEKIITAIIGAMVTMVGSLIQSTNPTASFVVIGVFGFMTLVALILLFGDAIGGKEIPLSRHSIFYKIEEWRVFVIKSFNLKKTVKKMVFQDVLYNSLLIYEKHLKKFVRIVDKTKDPLEIKTYVAHVCNDIVINIVNYFETNDTSYTDEDKSTLRIAVKKFLKWHTAQIENFKHNATEILLDNYFYGSIKIKMSIVLALFEGLIADTLRDARKTLEDINGDLKGLKFRNRSIEE